VIIVFPPIVAIYMGSYYAMSMTHVTYIWMFMVLSMDVYRV
jgi:hypothetical protein